MKLKCLNLLNLIRFRIIGTFFISIIITMNAYDNSVGGVDYRFIVPIIVIGCILLFPILRRRRILLYIYKNSVKTHRSKYKVLLLFALGFNRKLLNIQIKKRTVWSWILTGISILISITILIGYYTAGVNIWFLIIVIIIMFYRILNSLYS